MGNFLFLLLISLLSLSCAVDVINICSNEPKTVKNYGIIQHDSEGKACELNLTGDYDTYVHYPYLAFSNIVGDPQCLGNRTVYINSQKYCVNTSKTSPEVIYLGITRPLNVSIPQQVEPFTLEYIQAIVLCHGEIKMDEVLHDKTELPKLYVSQGYIPQENRKCPSTCSLSFKNKIPLEVSVELWWPGISQWIDTFSWSLPKVPNQIWTETKTNKSIELTYEWRDYYKEKFFIMISPPCSEPKKPKYGEIKHTHSDDYAPVHDDIICYTCNHGFTKRSQEDPVCQRDGSWFPTPFCIPLVGDDLDTHRDANESVTKNPEETSTSESRSLDNTGDVEKAPYDYKTPFHALLGICIPLPVVVGAVVVALIACRPKWPKKVVEFWRTLRWHALPQDTASTAGSDADENTSRTFEICSPVQKETVGIEMNNLPDNNREPTNEQNDFSRYKSVLENVPDDIVKQLYHERFPDTRNVKDY